MLVKLELLSTVTLLMNYWYILFSHTMEKVCKAAITINFSVQFILFPFFSLFSSHSSFAPQRKKQFGIEWNFLRSKKKYIIYTFMEYISIHIFYSVPEFTFIFYLNAMTLLLDIDLKAKRKVLFFFRFCLVRHSVETITLKECV